MERQDKVQTRKDFRQAVNMSPKELERWLRTDESRSVGWPKDGGSNGESVGHESGRRIIGLKRKTVDELTESDHEHMRKVVNYVQRHTAQRPSGNVDDTKWRYSLMNWGHDPLKKDGSS